VQIAVGILTHQVLSSGRLDVFSQTVESLSEQMSPTDLLYIVDNHSDDGSAEYVESLGGISIRDPVSTCGRGMNRTLSLCASVEPDLIVFSNDDIRWRPGALPSLAAFWEFAPADILIASGLQQDVYPWSTPRERVEYGGVCGLVRDSVPGGAWTLRAKDWPKIRPVPEASGWDDVPTCDRLRRKGYRVCALDLAEHLGEDLSTWGNDSARHGTPLDRAAWGLP
jgi:glycosyltransferase involved in cell wall biosynthesis